jgi:hypothetical protein
MEGDCREGDVYITSEWVGPQTHIGQTAATDHRSNQKTTDMFSTSPKSLYANARKRGRRGQRWSILGRRADRLLALSEVGDACNVRVRCHAGIRNVAMSQIRGSESRCKDFDGDFNPIQDHCMSRWLRVAAARDQGKMLPPVVLVQVGDVYFVRDGHHRISVARALGQLDIEAEVTVWHLSGPLPCDAHVEPSRPGLVDRLLGLGHAFRRRWLQGLAGSARSALEPMTANRLAEG